MEEEDGIYLEISGTFRFSVHQTGLTQNDLEYAIKDFWNELELSMDNRNRDIIAIGYDYDEKDLKID